MKQKTISSILLGTLIITFLFGLVNLTMGLQEKLQLSWQNLLSSLLISITIAFLIRKSKLSRPWLAGSIFFTYFIIGHFNILIEAYLFDVTSRALTLKELFRGFIVVTLFAPLAVLIYPREAPIDQVGYQNRSVLGWGWRIMVGDFLYFFLYGLAGFTLTSVYPQLLEFYGDKIPPLELILKTQLFLRAFLFMGIAVLISNTVQWPRFQKALLIGLTFSIFGGIAPLIPENASMPGFVRWGHLIEVGISNFIYGILLEYLIGRKPISQP